MNNNNKPEGPLDVSGEYTPITKQKIQQVETHRWHQMSISELYDQRAILESRVLMAAQIGNAAIMHQLQMGINHINQMIHSKSEADNKDMDLI